jgi:hypothetical protein
MRTDLLRRRIDAAIAAAFADASMCMPKGAPVEPSPGDRDRWRDHGRLTIDERHAVAREAIERIVWPAAARMLGRPSPRPGEARAFDM